MAWPPTDLLPVRRAHAGSDVRNLALAPPRDFLLPLVPVRHYHAGSDIRNLALAPPRDFLLPLFPVRGRRLLVL